MKNITENLHQSDCLNRTYFSDNINEGLITWLKNKFKKLFAKTDEWYDKLDMDDHKQLHKAVDISKLTYDKLHWTYLDTNTISDLKYYTQYAITNKCMPVFQHCVEKNLFNINAAFTGENNPTSQYGCIWVLDTKETNFIKKFKQEGVPIAILYVTWNWKYDGKDKSPESFKYLAKLRKTIGDEHEHNDWPHIMFIDYDNDANMGVISSALRDLLSSDIGNRCTAFLDKQLNKNNILQDVGFKEFKSDYTGGGAPIGAYDEK